MSAPNASAASDESVLIAYRWPATYPASDLPADIVALCPSDPPLERVPRVTGYILRGRVALGALNQNHVPPDTTAVTFFRITATAEQTERLAACAAEPIACCGGSAMVVWSRFSNISFNELADAEGLLLGLNAHLVALRATDLLRALKECMGRYYDGVPSGR